MKVKKAVIPAAGLGTRMLPETKTLPKEMLPIVDKPAIQYVVEEAVNSGIEEILILTNRSKTVMDDYFDYHPELEAKLRAAGREEDANMIRKVADMASDEHDVVEMEVHKPRKPRINAAVLHARKASGAIIDYYADFATPFHVLLLQLSTAG